MFKNLFKSLENKPVALWGAMAALFFPIIDSLFIKEQSDFWYFVYVIVWILFCSKHQIEGRISVLFGLSCLILSPFFMFFSQNLSVKFAIWAFLLLLSAAILIFKENKNE